MKLDCDCEIEYKWRPIDEAPRDGTDLLLKDDSGTIYFGTFDIVYREFRKYTANGLEEHQHAMEFKFPE